MKYYSQYNNLFVCPICGTRFVCNDRDAWAYKLGRNTPYPGLCALGIVCENMKKIIKQENIIA
jgi:hypothetical protein